MMTKYIINPQIVKILFQLKDDELVKTAYTDLVNQILEIFKEVAKVYLKENNVSENDINKLDVIQEDIQFENPIVSALLKDVTLSNRQEEAMQTFLEALFKTLVPTLSSSEQGDLDALLKLYQDDLALKKEESLNDLAVLKLALQNNEKLTELLKNQEFVQSSSANKIEDSNVNQQQENQPSINLGGSISQ